MKVPPKVEFIFNIKESNNWELYMDEVHHGSFETLEAAVKHVYKVTGEVWGAPLQGGKTVTFGVIFFILVLFIVMGIL